MIDDALLDPGALVEHAVRHAGGVRRSAAQCLSRARAAHAGCLFRAAGRLLLAAPARPLRCTPHRAHVQPPVADHDAAGGDGEGDLLKDFRTAVVAEAEAFNKAAKMMGLPYPGGPLIDQYAKDGDPTAFSFPETAMPGLNFSFSGIKTAFLYFLRDRLAQDPEFIATRRNDLCASLQAHLVSMLMQKLKRAAKETGIKQIAIAGGVAANSGLRNAIREAADKHRWEIFIPDFQYCTDNAAMIAMAAHYKFLEGSFATMEVAPIANLAIGL